jgi:hypothetical protein
MGTERLAPRKREWPPASQGASTDMEARRIRSTLRSSHWVAALVLLPVLAATAFIEHRAAAHGTEDRDFAPAMQSSSNAPKSIAFLRADDPPTMRENVRQSSFFAEAPLIGVRLERAAGL